MILARWSYVLHMLWSISCGVESLILYKIIAANGSSTLRNQEHRDLEISTSILRLFLLGSIAIRYMLCWHIRSTNRTAQMSCLMSRDLEANYGTNSSLPPVGKRLSWLRTIGRFLLRTPKSTILQLSFLSRILLVILQDVVNIFPWLSTFGRFLLHVWPNSTVLQLSFLSRILLVILQRIVNILLSYQSAKFMECLFQLHSNKETMLDPSKHTLYILILLGVLETCFIVLQSPLWSRIVQACRRRLSNISFRSIFPLGPHWHQQHSTSEKSSIIGKSRGPDKFIDETLFGILPALAELALAVGCASQRVGFYYASMLALNSGCNIMFTMWSAGHAAKLERAKDDAKHHIVDVRLVRIMIHIKKLLINS